MKTVTNRQLAETFVRACAKAHEMWHDGQTQEVTEKYVYDQLADLQPLALGQDGPHPVHVRQRLALKAIEVTADARKRRTACSRCG